MKTLLLLLLFAVFTITGLAAQAPEKSAALPFISEILWSGSWESRHNLTNRFGFKLTAPEADLALRLELLDRRPASSANVLSESFGGETADKAVTQGGLGLYHLSTGSRLLYGVLNEYGISARIRNIWIHGAPYVQSREESGAELRVSPAGTALPQTYAYLGNNGISLGPGIVSGFISFSAQDGPVNWSPALNAAVNYQQDKKGFTLEGYYSGRTLPERKSSTWFNLKPALPERDTRLFAVSLSFSAPSFAVASDLAYSETFAFGGDYYGNLGLIFGGKPWRFSLAFDVAGSRYIGSDGGNSSEGFRAAARLEKQGKKTGLFRLNTIFRGPGPENGLLESLENGDFAGIIQSFNRVSGELYYRFPAHNDPFGLTRYSFSLDRDARDEKKVLDSAAAMAAFKLGPVNATCDVKISLLNGDKSINVEEDGYSFNSFKLTQGVSWTVHGSKTAKNITEKTGQSANPGERKKTEKKGAYSIVFSARTGYEKVKSKEGRWDTSISASLRTRKNRVTVKAAASTVPNKWELTFSWRLLF